MSLSLTTFDVLINNHRIQFIREVNETLRKHTEGIVTSPMAMIAIQEIKEEYDHDVRELIETFDNKDEQEEAYQKYMNSLGF